MPRFDSLPALLAATAVLTMTTTGCQTSSSSTADLQPAEALLRLDRPLVIAHRGYSLTTPENTLAAFERAIAARADLVELDYHHSSDDRPVVIHDFTLDRTTDAVARWGGKDLKVVDYPLARLQTLDAGQWFKPPHDGLRLPELGEAIDVIQRGSVTLIERKAGGAATCVELVRARGLVNHVVVQSFDWNYLRDYHALEPAQILGALGPPGSRNGRKLEDHEKQLSTGWLDEIKALGARLAVWNRQVDRAAVQAAHERGLKVWVYTINDAKLAAQLLDLGVDGIITDDPAMLQEVLAGR